MAVGNLRQLSLNGKRGEMVATNAAPHGSADQSALSHLPSKLSDSMRPRGVTKVTTIELVLRASMNTDPVEAQADSEPRRQSPLRGTASALALVCGAALPRAHPTREVTMSLIRFAPAILLAAGVVSSAAAQDSTSCACRTVQISKPSEFELRSAGTITFIQSRPQGSLGQNISRGYGVDGAYLFRLDHQGVFSLRFGAGIVDYGHEAKHVPLSPTIGRIDVKIKTTNYLSQLTVGPQFTWPRGLIRPYVNAGIGGQVFFTESSVENVGSDDSSDLSTTNQSDWTSAWTLGTGVYVPVSRGVSLDAGVQFVNGGRAQYLKPGSIQDLGTQIQITPLESADTRVALVRLGIRIGL